MWRGEIVSTHIATNHSSPMTETDGVYAVAGKGIEGDRYAEERGFYSNKKGPQRQATLFEAEVLETIRRDQHVELSANECRMNLITRNVPLSHLVGRKFRVGEAVLRGIKINEPCQHLEDVVGKRVLSALVHRYGLNAEAVESGRIRSGDAVEALDTN
jgi:MOSC domain-containing protein YiiM